MNRIINFFLVGIKYFFKALFVGIFAIFIAGLFIIFIQELFWLLGYFGFKDFAALVFDVPTKPFTSLIASLKIDDPDLKIDDDPFLAIGADIIFAILALIIYILYFIFSFLLFILDILTKLPGSEIHFSDLTPFIVFVVPVITLIIFIFIFIIFVIITMKFLNDFKNKTYSKSFCFIVFLFFNCIYLSIFLGFSHSKFSELSNENLLFLVLAFCLGLISTYLTKIKFFKGEKYV
ncbi:MAG: hypothetical protein PUB35_01725 [Campylobacteraceae bacterium]|uniref:hypothetical protein n=1 Tax=Campylobacter sp. TaxID=205 RepID=UPI002AA9469C|nr:hypothetical protein [Campylobacter sp.]MCI6695451.1 hypothetical protein [Campylobacter sp.]MDD6161514.1 hypothetical protein [Campylobacteraceae bacterium]